jgi:hypothetical protein
MEVDDIISYHDVVTAERASLQKGMNYGVGKNYSVFLMSLRENAPYADALDEVTGMLTYEGHDEPQRQGGPNPKEVDQPLTTPKGSWTENGKFFRAAMDFKNGICAERCRSCYWSRANSGRTALSSWSWCRRRRRRTVWSRAALSPTHKSKLLS